MLLNVIKRAIFSSDFQVLDGASLDLDAEFVTPDGEVRRLSRESQGYHEYVAEHKAGEFSVRYSHVASCLADLVTCIHPDVPEQRVQSAV